MGIFGKLDAELIPTNPFWIEAGEYSAEVTSASIKENRDGQKQLVIDYTITDGDSQYEGKKVSHYFTLVDPNLTLEAFSLLPPEEQKSINRQISTQKRTLCGNDANAKQKGLGVSPDDLNSDDWKPETLVGTKIDLAIVNNGGKNEYVNIKWVNLQDA